MPPKEECPVCGMLVEDWHLEWYRNEGPALFQGQLAMDCPICEGAVGFESGRIGPAPPGVPVVRRNADKAAEWAALQALSAGGTLRGYLAADGAGSQYSGYWTEEEVQQADENQQGRE